MTSAFLLQSYLLHLCSQVPRSQWASLSVRTTYAYSSFSTHLTGLSTMKLQNIIATEVLFVKVFREFSENLRDRIKRGSRKLSDFLETLLMLLYCDIHYYIGNLLFFSRYIMQSLLLLSVIQLLYSSASLFSVISCQFNRSIFCDICVYSYGVLYIFFELF